ncbi:hypothetical protein [Malikia spinosa]|uniref:Uncharacterized protein n=1 Tax=Malikia spinosa TaxID=86180 RepID=A0A7C9NCW1_9BURK|nr:hypothetical protein [Malikia spinosa]MYZ53825.1 hypothetical protein [Malikia spinosa]
MLIAAITAFVAITAVKARAGRLRPVWSGAFIRSVMAWLALASAGLGLGLAVPAWAQDGAALRVRQLELRSALADNAFGRPLVLESVQQGDRLSGEIHAVIAQPFAVAAAALQSHQAWCDILMLHLNVKHCLALGAGADRRLQIAIGRKHDQPVADAFALGLGYRILASQSDYLALRLEAADGPLGTRDFRIALELTPAPAGGSFMRLSYSYRYGLAARLALQGYLATLGRDKVGFSIVGRVADGSPIYIEGLRGAVERNTLRYYLAIEAYLGALALPAAQRPERRLQAWFDATERHPLQLHELERDDYLAMKRRELARLAAGSAAVN